MTPLDRFALDRNRVRFLPPNQANDELFFVEEERHVRADNTFSFKSLRFEAPRHLPDRTIQVRFQRRQPHSARRRLLQGRTHGRSPPARPRRQRPQTPPHRTFHPRLNYDPLPLRPATPSLRRRVRHPAAAPAGNLRHPPRPRPARRPVPGAGRTGHRQKRPQTGAAHTTIPNA